MTHPHPHPPPLTPDAAYWAARMDSGEWSAQDEAALRQWLGDDKARHAELLETQACWMMLDQAEPVAETLPSPLWRRRRFLAAAAAGVAAMVGAARFWPRGQSFATRTGEIRRVPLNDGSVMMINSGSELAVEMSAHARNIELARGEAWFQVAKDATRPFVVAAGDVRAKAVGTAFAVRLREGGVEVNVTEGVVQTWGMGHDSAPTRLTAGERVLVTQNAVVFLDRGGDGSTEQALAWRNGMIDLSGHTLAEAAAEFNRYNTLQIVVNDPRVAGERMAGIFRIDDPRGFIAALRDGFALQVDNSQPGEVRITAKENGRS
ncbi:FecR family protein [Novosphingobium sediminicola]|uniref:Transmembrane sensor n=1 Tax=Novosphingobium sediminicola TaxID=563162 RepID=A0A7W6CGA0_9SPHN|nr:FecR domain-containing protein [Novosphingobium sediminicola]MBB3953783.1 transmembrane sensor [Novosphingobium sediminicola]